MICSLGMSIAMVDVVQVQNTTRETWKPRKSSKTNANSGSTIRNRQKRIFTVQSGPDLNHGHRLKYRRFGLPLHAIGWRNRGSRAKTQAPSRTSLHPEKNYTVVDLDLSQEATYCGNTPDLTPAPCRGLSVLLPQLYIVLTHPSELLPVCS